MLYIFQVDTGTMMPLDMNLALENVSFLKGVIARSSCIPPDKQILLISGGESLEADQRVCKYNAGTDTNPIFLFSMISIESPVPPTIPIDVEVDNELQVKVESSLSLPDAQTTVAVRAALAQEYVKVSEQQIQFCELLIHDQHMQNQGWLAVVANLEDIAMDLQKKTDALNENYRDYLQRRENYSELVETFDDDRAVLHKIPVFPALLDAASKKGTDTSLIGSLNPTADGSAPLSLLDWINRSGTQSLTALADGCYRTLEMMDEAFLEELKQKVSKTLESCNNIQMKEIGGLGERLSGLEQLLLEANKVVREQTDLAQAFLSNQARASGLRDASILPDLCASHRQQLLVMMKNYQSVLSYRKRCLKAKEELSANLHSRLKWIVYIQQQMAEVGQTVVMHHHELRRLRNKMQVIEQLHMAPTMYMATAVEVVRRRAFSEKYFQKASVLSASFKQIYMNETALRTEFHSKLKRHFLAKLFPGMDDMPPKFATECPALIDDRLPLIEIEDVETLRNEFPDLAKSLSVPDGDELSNLLTRSFDQALTAQEGETLYLLNNMANKLQVKSDIGSVSVMNNLMCQSSIRRRQRSDKNPNHRRSFDSETDTDELDRSPIGNGRRKRIVQQAPPIDRSLTDKPLTVLLDSDTNRQSSSSSGPPPSSGNTTGNNSSVAPNSSSSDGSVMKQVMHDSQLAKLAEDRAHQIAALSTKISEAEEQLEKLRSAVDYALTPSRTELNDLKAGLAAIRDQVVEETKSFGHFARSMQESFVNQMEHLSKVSELDRDRQIGEVEKRVRTESESDVEKVRERLELELHKLEDCHREIEIYRNQLEHATQEIDRLKSEMIDEKEKAAQDLASLRESSEREKDELQRRLTLEHELELDNLRQEMEKSGKLAECLKELDKLKDELASKDRDVEGLKRKTRLLEASSEERFQGEKDKIVQILEAGFAQREKLAVQEIERKLKMKHLDEVCKYKEEQESYLSKRLEELREELAANHRSVIEAMQAKFEEEREELKSQQDVLLQQSLQEERAKLESEKEMELKTLSEKLRKKAKNEIEGLRSRFRMMQMVQSNAGQDRSPSASESELSIGSPPSDFVDSIRSSVALEYENNLRAERARWENRIQQIEQEHQAELNEYKSTEMRKDRANQQQVFNDALKRAVEQKDRKIEELMLEKSIVEQKASRLEGQLTEGGGNPRCAELEARNAELEQQLDEMRRRFELQQQHLDMNSSVITTVPSSSSIVGMDTPESLVRLQRENQTLRDHLTRSMSSVISSGRVTVTSVDRGDIVMIVWSEDNNSFSVYNENSNLYFVHSDSYEALGINLVNGRPQKRYTTAEVVDKEYCQAKKPENRFRVPQGTKFYRVKCRPPSQSANMSISVISSVSNGSNNESNNGDVPKIDSQ